MDNLFNQMLRAVHSSHAVVYIFPADFGPQTGTVVVDRDDSVIAKIAASFGDVEATLIGLFRFNGWDVVRGLGRSYVATRSGHAAITAA